MTIRAALLVGVSTDLQAAEERASIPNQIETCRKAIRQFDGIETACYIMDGFSRSGYDSLDVAMAEIPPLGDVIRAAMADEFDVLVLDHYDRLGDLGLMVGTRFRKLRKQLYSARQSGAVADPETYNPFDTESADIDMYVSGIIQRYRINKIRRGWNLGVPARARRGLHPLALPYGYRTTGKDTPAEQIPEEVALIKAMAAMYLSGKTLQEICDYANATHKPRRAHTWKLTVVKRIILNRFYAGITTFGKLKTVNKKRVRVPPSQWITGQGQHVPIYTMETYNALLLESERRDSTRSRSKVYTLSGLLSCSVCDGKLHRHGKTTTRYPVDLSCPKGCVNIYYKVALQLVARTIVRALRDFAADPHKWDEAEKLESEIQVLEDKRVMVQEGYEAKVYSKVEAGQKIHDLEIEKEKLVRQLERSAQQQEHRQRLMDFIETNDIEGVRDVILMLDPTEVNLVLTALCQTIVVTPRYEMRVVWR